MIAAIHWTKSLALATAIVPIAGWSLPARAVAHSAASSGVTAEAVRAIAAQPDDFETPTPPDNGGPSSSQGSGTR